MTYKDEITRSMTWLGKQKKSVFLGQGLINASRIYSTLSSVPLRKCIEMPIAENLIVGTAIGLAIEGYRPIVVFQRMDFMLIAADALINHASLIPKMSGGQIQIPLIIRAIIGLRDRKFWVGEQHNHDFTHIFEPYIRTVRIGNKGADAMDCYSWAWEAGGPVLVVEDKDLYEKEGR